MSFSLETFRALSGAAERSIYLKQHVFRVGTLEKVHSLVELSTNLSSEEIAEIGIPLPYFTKKYPTLVPGTGSIEPAFEVAAMLQLPDEVAQNEYLRGHLEAAQVPQRLAIIDKVVDANTDLTLQRYAPTLVKYQPELRLLRSII